MTGTPLTPRTSDIMFLEANDRYQVVACAKRGTATTTSEFRYWYANAPLWNEALSSTTTQPYFFTTDENSEYVPGSLELPFKEVKIGQEMKIEGVLVEFIPRPSAITEATVDGLYTLGFSLRVEGHGVPDITRTISTTTVLTISSGTMPSNTMAFADLAGNQDSSSWPNVKTVYVPVRLTNRVRSIRVVFTDIHLCAIRRVQVLGEILPMRTT